MEEVAKITRKDMVRNMRVTILCAHCKANGCRGCALASMCLKNDISRCYPRIASFSDWSEHDLRTAVRKVKGYEHQQR